MNIKITGEGLAALFIHGYCETLNIWTPYHQALSDHFKVISIDLPGHGSTPALSPGFSIDEVAKVVHEAMVKEEITSYFPIGHSLGGYVALSLYEQYSVHISGVGLFSSTTFADDEEKKKARDKVKGFLEEHGVDAFIDSFVPALFKPENRRNFPAAIDALKVEGKKMNAETIDGYAQAMKNRPDRTHVFDQKEKPMFVIAGDRDMAVKLEASQMMIDKIQKGDSLILNDVGHNGFMEAEKESINFISSFLKQHLP